MEMEELFLQLCEEVGRLQDLCTKQGELLQKLMARQGPVLDIPVSLPIQCTEDMVTEEGQGTRDSAQNSSEAAAPAGSAHPLAQLLPSSHRRDQPSGTTSSVCGGGAGGVALALGSSKAERSQVDVDPWLKTCRMFPALQTLQEEVRACCSLQEPAEPPPAGGDSFPALVELCEAPETLQREDAPSESALPAEAKGPVEIRGPMKTSWTPGWMLEDGSLGQGTLLTSQDAQACDICQEIFPSDAAGQEDYLKHVLAHMK